MGYGLAGAIGAALANTTKRTFLVEGDGGFAQNMQEIGTVVANQLNLKIFIFDNQGYGSIRSNQRNYFGPFNCSNDGVMCSAPSVHIASTLQLHNIGHRAQAVKMKGLAKKPVL